MRRSLRGPENVPEDLFGEPLPAEND